MSTEEEKPVEQEKPPEGEAAEKPTVQPHEPVDAQRMAGVPPASEREKPNPYQAPLAGDDSLTRNEFLKRVGKDAAYFLGGAYLCDTVNAGNRALERDPKDADVNRKVRIGGAVVGGAAGIWFGRFLENQSRKNKNRDE